MDDLTYTIKRQPTSESLANNRLSILHWLNGFEEKNIIEFESITSIASDICKTPTTLIGLIDNDDFQFKSEFNPSEKQIFISKNICQKVVEKREAVDFSEFDDITNQIVFCMGIPLKTSEGVLVGVLCTINDNRHTFSETEKNALENLAKLTASLIEQRSVAIREERQLKFLEENTSVEMYLVSPTDLKVVFANNNALRSLGYSSGNFLDQDVTEILVTRKKQEFKQNLHELVVNDRKSFSTFAHQVNKDGSKDLVKLFVSFVQDGFDSLILIISRNLSNAGFESDFVDYLSNYDSITGLANRRLFENLISEKIHTSIDAPETSGLLLIDLENFRFLNKSFGYKAGDNIVRQLSKVLVQFLSQDEILVRTSYDTFCVLIPNCNKAQIKQKAIEIIDLVDSQEFSESDKRFKIQINIGALIMGVEDSAATDYLSIAHKACDIAKEFGQNQFYLAEPTDSLFIQKTLEMEQLINVQDAIERNKLQLYAQKIQKISADAETYQEHFEILIRMTNKENQIIPPMAFIPQLEKHGSIVSLDKWVLKESLKMINSRHRNVIGNHSSAKFLYNINLSARTISDACFISYCTELLVNYAHLAPYICFEVTETVAISNFKTAQEFIQIISRFGCKFALDDFGSGSASLEYLKELSIDFVKIDGSFVSDILDNPISQIIVESICKVANILNVKVIAEKVETQEIEDRLLDFGVHYVQGYKVQRPIPFKKQI